MPKREILRTLAAAAQEANTGVRVLVTEFQKNLDSVVRTEQES